MPTNRIRIISDDTGVKCKIWDNSGVKYDVSSIFKKSRDEVTMGLLSSTTEIDFKHGTNSLRANLKFQAGKKDLRYDVDESVINQIIQLGAVEDEEPN